MEKKKKKPVSRVSPTIDAVPPKFTKYDDLKNGDAFLYAGALHMKCNNCEQEAIDLDTGRVRIGMCREVVKPVNIKITWTKKK